MAGYPNFLVSNFRQSHFTVQNDFNSNLLVKIPNFDAFGEAIESSNDIQGVNISAGAFSPRDPLSVPKIGLAPETPIAPLSLDAEFQILVLYSGLIKQFYQNQAFYLFNKFDDSPTLKNDDTNRPEKWYEYKRNLQLTTSFNFTLSGQIFFGELIKNIDTQAYIDTPPHTLLQQSGSAFFLTQDFLDFIVAFANLDQTTQQKVIDLTLGENILLQRILAHPEKIIRAISIEEDETPYEEQTVSSVEREDSPFTDNLNILRQKLLRQFILNDKSNESRNSLVPTQPITPIEPSPSPSPTIPAPIMPDLGLDIDLPNLSNQAGEVITGYYGALIANDIITYISNFYTLLNGNEDENSFQSSVENELFDGLEGTDQLAFTKERNAYEIFFTEQSIIFIDKDALTSPNNTTGVDKTINIENFLFTDQTYSAIELQQEHNRVSAYHFGESGSFQTAETESLLDLELAPLLYNGSQSGYVAIWIEHGVDGSDSAVISQKLAANGSPLDRQIRINNFRPGEQSHPKIQQLTDGSYLVIWQSDGVASHGFDISARRFDADFNPTSGEFVINHSRDGNQIAPEIFDLENNEYIVIWQNAEGHNAEGFPSYQLQIHDYDDNLISPIIDLNVTAVNLNQQENSFHRLENGHLALLSYDPANHNYKISLLDLNGNIIPQFSTIPVSETNAEVVNDISFTALKSGGFLLTKTKIENGESFLTNERYSSAGLLIDLTPLNVTTTTNQIIDTDTIPLEDGGYITFWAVHDENNITSTIYSQQFDLFGQKYGNQQTVITTNNSVVNSLTISPIDAENFTISWTETSHINNIQSGHFLNLQLTFEEVIHAGTDNDDQLIGNGRDETFLASAGKDQIDGQQGEDILRFTKNREDYLINFINGKIQIIERTTDIPLNIIQARNIEIFEFADVTLPTSELLNTHYIQNQFILGDIATINTTTTADQITPVITPYKDGGYIYVWTAYGKDASGTAISSQIFNSDGEEVLHERRLNDFTPNDQRNPSAITLADGSIVAVWQSDGIDSNGIGISRAIITPDGSRPPGTNSLINQERIGDQTAPQIFNNFSTGYTILWHSHSNGIQSLKARQFDQNHTPIQSELTLVNNLADGFLLYDFQENQNGDLHVTWKSDSGFFTNHYTANGSLLNQQQIAKIPHENIIDVQYNSPDSFIILWAVTSSTNQQTIFSQQINFNDFNLSLPKQIIAHHDTPAIQTGSKISLLEDGAYFVSWQVKEDGLYKLYGRKYNAFDQAASSDILITSNLQEFTTLPTTTFTSLGQLVLSWTVADENNIHNIKSRIITFKDSAQTIIGTDGDDIVTNGSGNDIIDGLAGIDILELSGKQSDYEIFQTQDGYTITDLRTTVNDGFDTIQNIEKIRFSDTEVTLSTVFDSNMQQTSVKENYRREANFTTEGQQQNAAIATAHNGVYFVIWESENIDGFETAIVGQPFDENGNPLNYERRYNNFRPGAQHNPQITALTNGNFVVTFQSFGVDLDAYGISAVIIGPQGQFIKQEFVVNRTRGGNQTNPQITQLANGEFIISWNSDISSTDMEQTVYFQRYDENGNRLGLEKQLILTGESSYEIEDITELKNGNLAVLLASNTQKYIQYLDRQQNLIKTVALSDTSIDGTVTMSKLEDGGLALAYVQAVGDTAYLVTQRFDSLGNQISPPYQIKSFPSVETDFLNAVTPTLINLPNGGYLVAWTSPLNEMSPSPQVQLHLQAFDPAGAAFGPLQEIAEGQITSPELSLTPTGNILITWSEYLNETEETSVFHSQLQFTNDDTILLNNENINVSGGIGDDIYKITETNQHYIINNNDSDSDQSTDQLIFQEDITPQDIWFSKTNEDLTIQILKDDTFITVTDWFNAEHDNYMAIDHFQTFSGDKLEAPNVQLLIDVMSSFSPNNFYANNSPESGEDNNVMTTITANWTSSS